ncbi:uncharacterized protein LOC129747466 [Uranotaenia lowii]|uniref:uncharacterized protein LOC129747466 n=1 Tax=Uranotaenia lowii TaxID=190385 RepID=UPI0024788225|nr:uncharacterized protein LOC129747466 [Uranotaenia lowii]
MLLVALLSFAFVTITPASGLQLKCTENLTFKKNETSDPFCLIRDYPESDENLVSSEVNATTTVSVRLPFYPRICFYDVMIKHLSGEILLTDTCLTDLIVYYSTVPKMDLVPIIQTCAVHASTLQQIVIDPGNQQYNLRVLNVTSNEMKQLPDHLHLLKLLESIDFNDNQIEVLNFDSFKGLGLLKSIYLEKNKICEWYLNSISLPSLVKLNVANNAIQWIPNNVSLLASLEELNLRKNKLQFVEMSIFNRLIHLKQLDLSENQLLIGSIAPVVLPSLEMLALKNCALPELDMYRWKLPKLRLLYLQANRLQYINHFPEDSFGERGKLELHGTENRWSCTWLQQRKNRVMFVGRQDYQHCSKYVHKVCCFEGDYNLEYRADQRVQAVKNQNRQIFRELGEQREMIRQMGSKVERLEAAMAGVEKKIDETVELVKSFVKQLENI